MEYLFVCVLKLNRQIYVESLLGVHGHAPPALIYVSVGNLIYTYTYKHICMLMLYIFSTQNRTSFTAALAWLEYCENVFVKSRHIHTAEHNIVAKFAIRLAQVCVIYVYIILCICGSYWANVLIYKFRVDFDLNLRVIKCVCAWL